MVSLNCQNNSFSINSPPPLPVFLGFPGENGTRPVQIDVSAWLDEFPEGAVSIVYTRADKLTYVVVVNDPGPVVTWKPLRRDLVKGACQIQVQIQQGDDVKKNRIVDCVVGESLDDPNDPPQEPQPSYVEDVIDAADRAEAAVEHYPQIRNGYWWVWDVESGEWVNTGVKATGEGGGSETVIVTIDDTTDPPTASMTAAEIEAASTAGRRVIVQYLGFELDYFGILDDVALFTEIADTTSISYIAILINARGEVLLESVPLATRSDLPTQEQMALASVFVAVRGTTTEAQIRAAHSAGKVVLCVHQNRVYYLSDDDTVMLRTAPDAQGKVYALVVAGNRWTGITYDLALASAIPTKTSQLINDSIKEPLYLTVTTENGVTFFDKTPAEIDALSAAGYDVHVRMQIPAFSAMCDLRFVGFISNAGYAALSAEYRGQSAVAAVAPDKSVTIYATNLYESISMVETELAQVASDKADKISRVVMDVSDEVVTLQPNTLYVFPEMSALTITLVAPADLSIVNEYHFIFSSGATATVTDFLQIPGLDDFAAEANMAYEISILEGHALVVSWEVTA